MNKKLFFGFFATIGMLFATSCTQDEFNEPSAGDYVEAKFTLNTPEGIATRAIGDGTQANVVTCAVFNENGEELKDLRQTVRVSGKTATYETRLVRGQAYRVAFFAYNEDADAYDVEDMTNIKVNGGQLSNVEARDAFTAKVDVAASTFPINKVVTLYRPFAQLNLGASAEDVEAAEKAGFVVTKSQIKVSNVYTAFNAYEDAVAGEPSDVTFTMNVIPTEDLSVDLNGDAIIGEDEKFEYLALNYILVGDAGSEKSLTDIEFIWEDANGTQNNPATTFNNIPVQRNYRTNVVGSILTNPATFNIVIDDKFEDDHNVELPYATIGDVSYKSFADAMVAVQDGDTIKLVGEITLDGVADGYLFTIDGKNITIDLNGYGFAANVPDVTKNSAIFRVAKNSGLTIIGEGNVKVKTAKAPDVLAAFINNDGGTVNLKGGNWTMTALEYPDALIPTFVDNNSNVNSATLNIYDGTYTFHRNLFRNFANAASHNNYATVATINIYGGTFNGRESDAGAIWNQKPSQDTPAGAGVINVIGGTFNNVEISDDFSGVVYANSNDELKNALDDVNTHTIILGEGKYVPSFYPGDVPARKSLTIIGSEGTQFAYTGSNYAGQFGLAGFDNITIRNCEILKRENVKDWGMIVFGSSNNPNGVYTLENCTFNGVGTQGLYINENASGATYNILNCTFNGDFGTEGAITIQTNKDVNHIVNVKGCTFNNIPATSHRIFLAKNPEVYYDFTLNTDIEASTAYEIRMLANFGYPTRVYGLTLIPNGDNSKIIINDKEGFLNLTKLFADWSTLFTDGNGTSYTNYANGAGVDYYYSGNWKVSLEADIDLNNANISPVVINHPVSAGTLTFEGNNHTIKNAKIVTDVNTQNEAGLFTANYCAMKNLKLDNIHVTGSNVGNSTAGVLTGSNNAGIDNITITNSSVTNGKYTGGVIGYGYTSVTNCALTNVTVKGGYKLGGLIGYICASGGTNDVIGNTLTDCTVDGIGGGVYAGGKNEYIIGKVVGNYNCNGTCNNNTITNMTTSATANIGEIESGMTVTQ